MIYLFIENLASTFKIITLLYSAIAYVHDETRIRQYQHCRPIFFYIIYKSMGLSWF